MAQITTAGRNMARRITTTRRGRKHAQNATQRRARADDGMRQATHELSDAIHALTDPQPHPAGTAPPRYSQLRQALFTHHGGNGNHARAHTIPASVDVLKYCLEIDHLAIHIAHKWPADHCQLTDRNAHPTIRALRATLTHHWKPADNLDQINAATQALVGYTRKIDDLFAPAPIYLPNPCPQCGHTHARKRNDEGDIVTTPALAVTLERGAICQQCHQTWPPGRLAFLGRVLGYQPISPEMTRL